MIELRYEDKTGNRMFGFMLPPDVAKDVATSSMQRPECKGAEMVTTPAGITVIINNEAFWEAHR